MPDSCWARKPSSLDRVRIVGRHVPLSHLDRGYVGSSQWLIANALKPTDLLGIANARPDLFGEPLHAFLRTASHHLATMTFVGENLPQANNRVILSDHKDPYGVPLARVAHDFGPDDIRCFEAGMREGQAVFKAAGAYDVWVSGRANQHIMGGTIMGREPGDSVVDSYGRAPDVDNLFIAGPGLFPTSGAVNPTFTIHALSLRTAQYILQNWSTLI